MELNIDFEDWRTNTKDEIDLIDLKQGFMYPDTGGYTGFCVAYRGGKFEGRFFVFGQLYDHRFISVYEEDNALLYANALLKKWKPIMDSICKKEKELWTEPNRHVLHVSEVFTEDLKRMLYI